MATPGDVKAQIQSMEKEAFAKYQTGQFSEALVLLQQILHLDTKHSLAKFYLEKIKKQMKMESPSSGSSGALGSAASAERAPSLTMSGPVAVTREEPFLQKDKAMHSPTLSPAVSVSTSDAGKQPTTTRQNLIKVVVVDDSSLMRKVLIKIFEKCPQIKVIGEAANGEQALEVLSKIKPDVLTLDVNMPVMDGVAVLKHIVVGSPMPVIMLSAFTEEGATTTFDCLTYGAVDFICKPSREGGSLSGQEDAIIQKVCKAAQVQVQPMKKIRVSKEVAKSVDLQTRNIAKRLILMGAGEGGYSGFLKILPHLPEHLPCAVMAVQYMEDKYFEVFCHYLNQYSHIFVKKAEDQELIREGVCYLTNQKVYLKIQSSPDGYRCQVAKKPDFLMQQNVFNHLLFSAAETYGANSIGVVLAGKGIDGIEGIREVKRVRGMTFAQDPKNCITPQLSQIAINSGIIDRVVADADFPGVLWHIVKSGP
jgi:two-component system chemotaxis response regulator CheB